VAVRTTAALVKGIIEVDEDSIPDLDPFILTANELVTECCGSAGYTATRLELIERWLAAHFVAIRDPRLASEQAGVSARYQHKVGLILQVTTYGQQAMTLDTAGGLAALSKRAEEGKTKSVGITWLGTDLDEDDD
jgi:hypothetical protein